jgi:hypothetical protein
MSRRAVEEGTAGRSWSHAMDAMVACYREGIAISREQLAKPSNARVRPRSKLPRYLLLTVALFCAVIYWATPLL